MMTLTTRLSDKYRHYRSIGHAAFCVTLSTYVKSEAYAKSDRMRHYWDNHFIFRVKRCLPFKAKIDHDWVVECSPKGFYHYHGFLAVESAYVHKVWTGNALHKQLRRDLDSLAIESPYRPFRVNAHLIEPVNNVEAWTTYSTKQNQPYTYT